MKDTGPRRELDPWDQFAHLTFALEEVPQERRLEPAERLVAAAHIVIRNMHGQRTRAEAYAALDIARAAILAANRADKALPSGNPAAVTPKDAP